MPITGPTQQIDDYSPDGRITPLGSIATGDDCAMWDRMLIMLGYEVVDRNVPATYTPMNGVAAIHTKSVEAQVFYLLAELPEKST